MTRFVPADLAELRDAVAAALAAEEPVEIVGGGSKRALGRPLQTPHMLDLSRLAGIRDYAPSELVLTAGAATPLAEIERALAEAARCWPSSRRTGALCSAAGEPTANRRLGGVLACNLSGPRRIKAGAARDHFLGFRGVSGRGEIVQGRRQGRQKRHRLRSLQADGRVLRDAGGARGGHGQGIAAPGDGRDGAVLRRRAGCRRCG